MIIDRYISREVSGTFVAVALVLLLITLSASLVALFQKVATGVLPVDAILVVLGLKAVVNLELVLPLSLFLAVLLALSRLYKDSEMIALAACGVGPVRVLRSVLGLSLVFAFLVGAVSLWLAPLSQETSERIIALAGAKSEIAGLAPGRFRELKSGIGAVYVEEASDDRSELRNLFGQKREGRRQVIFTARYGYQRTDPDTGDKYLVLEDGARYEGEPGKPDFTIIEFQRHTLRLEERLPELARLDLRRSARPTRTLLASTSPADLAEFQSRVSSVLVCVVFTVLAVPLSRTSPRRGQYARLAVAVLVYIIYSNLLNVARAWVQREVVPAWLGMWWVHGLMLAVALALLAAQSGFRPWAGWRPLPGR